MPFIFKLINNSIIAALTDLGVKQLGNKGISDISIGMKKILGSSIYRKQKTIFYHAVLNVSEPIETISMYLKHPTREPDYRRGRDHYEFVTSLKQEGYEFTIGELINQLNKSISRLVSTYTNWDLCNTSKKSAGIIVNWIIPTPKNYNKQTRFWDSLGLIYLYFIVIS